LAHNLNILFFCAFSKKNKNGVQRFADEIIKGIETKEKSIYSIYWNKENGFIRSFVNLIKEFILTIRHVNVVHFVVLTPFNVPFLITAKILRKKILTSYHGNHIAESPFSKRPHIFLAFLIADKTTRMLSNSIVSSSSYLLDQLKINKKKSYIIPYPFDSNVSQDIIKKNLKKKLSEIILMTASNFNIKEKVNGLHFLFDAMNNITKESHEVKLCVFGGGTYLEEFQSKYKYNQNICFMGFRNDFRSFLKDADAYIHISGLDNQPYAIMDALMLGKVVVCNDIGGVKEMIEASNNYIVTLDTSSISNAIYNVISEIRNNHKKFLEKGQENRLFAIKRFSSEAVSLQYINLYRNLLDQYNT
jgi:glycosyltransferase involved in cell wall biosynthesis